MKIFTTVANVVVPHGPGGGGGTAITGGVTASAIAGSTFVAQAWGYVPGIVAVIAGCMAIIWYSIAIYESSTIKSWRIRHAQTQKTRRIARLKAKEKVIVAQLEALELKRTAAVTASEILRSAEHAAAEKVTAAAAAAKVEKMHAEIAAAIPEDAEGQDG